MKKTFFRIISLIMCLSMTLPFNLMASASSSSELTKIEEIELSSYKETDLSSLNLENKNEIIIHNNGKAIETDYLVRGKESGNHVVAIRYENTSAGTIETIYYANVESIEKTELNTIISSDKKNTRSLVAMTFSATRSSSSPIIKRHQWSFYDGNSKMAIITTTTEYYKESGNASLNNTTCSIWDVVTFTQYEKVNCMRIEEQYTRLSVESFASEYLLSYGPIGNKSGGEVSVGLDGAGVPSFGYSFSIDGFSVKDLSSISNKYGRWRFVDYIGNEDSFTTQPGIRVANTSGSLVVELSHTVQYKNASGSIKNSATGVVQDWITDR